MKTKRTYEEYKKIHLKPEKLVCEMCGTKLVFRNWIVNKYVVTLEGVLRIKSEGMICPNDDCECHRNKKELHISTLTHKYALPKATFGLDIIAFVGFKRINENKNFEEIHKALEEKKIIISRRNVDNLYKSFEYLIKCSLPMKLMELKKEFDKSGGIILSIDGLQPHQGSDVLYVLRDTITTEVLHAFVTHSTDTASMVELFKVIKDTGITVKGIVSDGQHSIRKAKDEVFPGIPYQLCTFHFLKDLGKPIGEKDRALKNVLKKNSED